MATPRGGLKWFEAMGQQAASRGISYRTAFNCVLLTNTPECARHAFRGGYTRQMAAHVPFSAVPAFTVSVPSSITDHDITMQLVRTMRAEGKSLRAIAKELNKPESTIRGWLKKEGL